jgi:peptide/nickel transport system permease protein
MRNLVRVSPSLRPSGGSAHLLTRDGDASLERETRVSRRAVIWRRFRRQRTAMAGGIVLLALVLSAVFANLLAPYDPAEQIPKASLQPPSTTYLFGTDVFGRDIFSRILYGGRISLRIGLISVAIAASNGIVLGLIAGYYRRWIDGLIMRVMDMLLALPGILLALVIVAVLGPSITNVMFAVGASVIPVFTRVVRGSVLAARETAYVEAARVVGCANPLILRRHILPNIVAPVIVLGTLNIAWAIIIGASLSYLGVGVQPPVSEWGAMLSDGRDYLRGQWWIATFPGVAIFITVLSMNLLGDGLREALDPRISA